MSKTVYDEAIADAKLLRETAEQNAKNAIIEAVTPRIRSFIEEQLMNQDNVAGDCSDVLEGVASDIVSGGDQDVILDESALMSLLEIFGDKNISDVSSQEAVKHALSESFDSLALDDREKLLQIANKLGQNIDLLSNSRINNDMSAQQENSNMSRSRDVIYEVDLDELSSLTAEMMSEDDDVDVEEAEEEELAEIMRSLGIDHLLKEDKIEIDLGDVELPEDIQILASVLADEEDEDVDLDLEIEDEEVEDDGEEVEEEEEVFEIDENVLRSELKRLRGRISEAKELIKIKGIKNDMSHSWGGKGDGKAGLKGSYGGTGKGGGDSFGGGKRGGDPLKVTLNKLSEAIRQERRKNRSLQGRLGEYRSAVGTLREQLTDLNLFNAKLLYVNKLLQSKDVSASQRRTVVESIDNAKSLREVKLVYKTLIESYSKGPRGSLRESVARKALGSSARATGSSSAQTASSEINRWAQLAGIQEKK